MRIVKARDFEAEGRFVPERDPAVEEVVAAILDDVRQRGDEAVLDYTERFDGFRPELKLDPVRIAEARAEVDPDVLKSLEAAAENIRRYHEAQKLESFELTGDGTVIGQRVMPLDRVGLYVPGGTARYPSSVLMNAIPAKVAGVPDIAMVTPVDDDGRIPPIILAAASVAGVGEIYPVGGAQAVAALAYGTESIRPVHKIVGPGNIYVATAKRQVYGLVDIDMIAGPSEILVVADDSANPAFVAADLLSQAEHDPLARSMLICFDAAFAAEVRDEVYRQLEQLSRSEMARTAVENEGLILIAEDKPQALDLANRLAAEHLELAVEHPEDWLPGIRHAGSVFMGHYTPEPIGDYWAGPNHTLPTSGTAVFASPLGVPDFMKRSSYIRYTKDALAAAAEDTMRLARHEGLDAHARAVAIRLEEEDRDDA